MGKPQVIMRIVSKHESPMDRQITEAIRISKLSQGDGRENLNAKAEWGIPRTSTMGLHIGGDFGTLGQRQSKGRDKTQDDGMMKGKRKQWRTPEVSENREGVRPKRLRMSGPEETKDKDTPKETTHTEIPEAKDQDEMNMERWKKEPTKQEWLKKRGGEGIKDKGGEGREDTQEPEPE